jgi:formiminotetrahydrofolate cyclodeaminase
MAPASELPFLDALASPAASPGAGAAAARVGALAAALIEMGCGRAGPGSRAHELRKIAGEARTELERLGAEDAAILREHLARKDRESRVETCEVPLQIAELAARLPRLIREVQLVGNPKAMPDLGAALRIAEAAREAAAGLVRANLRDLDDSGLRAGFLRRLDALG